MSSAAWKAWLCHAGFDIISDLLPLAHEDGFAVTGLSEAKETLRELARHYDGQSNNGGNNGWNKG